MDQLEDVIEISGFLKTINVSMSMYLKQNDIVNEQIYRMSFQKQTNLV